MNPDAIRTIDELRTALCACGRRRKKLEERIAELEAEVAGYRNAKMLMATQRSRGKRETLEKAAVMAEALAMLVPDKGSHDMIAVHAKALRLEAKGAGGE